jgi:hypothetical protein
MAKIVEYTLGDKFDYFYDSTIFSTNSISIVKMSSLLIPANSMNATGTNTVFRLDAGIRKTGTTAAAVVYFYVNTADSLTSAVQLATYTVTSSLLTATFSRFGAIAATNSTVFLTTTTNSQSDYSAIAGAAASINIDWTVNQYLILGGAVLNAADTIGSFFFKVSN